MRRLLVGYDGSPLAAEAARLAGWLAQRAGATVTVLYVEPEPGVLDALRRAAPASAEVVTHAGGELVRAQIPPREHGNPPVEVRTAAGDPSEMLAAAAASADLVLVGHHGRSGLTELVMGSVAKHLVAAAAPPVMVVRGSAPAEIRHVLVGTDGSAGAERAVHAAIDLARVCGARITLLSIVEFETLMAGRATTSMRLRMEQEVAAKTALLAAAEACEAAGVPVEAVQVTGSPAAVLLDQATTRGADIIAVGRSGRHETSPDGVGRVAGELLRQASGTVLVAA